MCTLAVQYILINFRKKIKRVIFQHILPSCHNTLSSVNVFLYFPSVNNFFFVDLRGKNAPLPASHHKTSSSSGRCSLMRQDRDYWEDTLQNLKMNCFDSVEQQCADMQARTRHYWIGVICVMRAPRCDKHCGSLNGLVQLTVLITVRYLLKIRSFQFGQKTDDCYPRLLRFIIACLHIGAHIVETRKKFILKFCTISFQYS